MVYARQTNKKDGGGGGGGSGVAIFFVMHGIGVYIALIGFLCTEKVYQKFNVYRKRKKNQSRLHIQSCNLYARASASETVAYIAWSQNIMHTVIY